MSHPSSASRKLKQENCYKFKASQSDMTIPNLSQKENKAKKRKRGLSNFVALFFSTLVISNYCYSNYDVGICFNLVICSFLLGNMFTNVGKTGLPGVRTLISL